MTSSRPAISRKSGHSSSFALIAAVVTALGLAGCGSGAHGGKTGRNVAGGEIDPRLGVAASPRMISDGRPIPKGGGRVMVGKPYVVGGKRYYPQLDPNYKVVGTASWYGNAFHGRKTANGEIFDSNSLSAAHPTMPLPSYARITNINNGRSVIVRVNDRGPFHSNRVLDMSRRAADLLGVRQAGIGKVEVDYIGPAPVSGSDDSYLMASYRGPSDVPTGMPETMVASNDDSIPGVMVRGLTAAVDMVTPSAEPVQVAAAAPAAPAVAPTAEGDAGFGAPEERVAADHLPPPRPMSYETYVMVATADPALSYLAASPVQVATNLAPNAVTQNAFQGNPSPVDNGLLPNEQPGPSNYAANRIDAAYGALDEVGAGVGLAELSTKLAVRTASGPVIDVGIFAKASNAEHIAKALKPVGVAVIDDISVGGQSMKRVRLTGIDPAVGVDGAIAAAIRAGSVGARLVN